MHVYMLTRRIILAAMLNVIVWVCLRTMYIVATCIALLYLEVEKCNVPKALYCNKARIANWLLYVKQCVICQISHLHLTYIIRRSLKEDHFVAVTFK